MSQMQRGALIGSAVAAYLVGLWPTWRVRDFVLDAFGNPRVAFGATHTQYPYSLQALIAAVAVIWASVGRRGGGLLSPYTAHMTVDWVIDPIL